MAESDIDKLVAEAPDEARKKSFGQWAGKKRQTLALTFTDIVDSTKLAVALGDPAMAEVREAHFGRSLQLIQENDGHEVKTIGDSVMATFFIAEAAFEYARALCDDPGHSRLIERVRAGIHVGPMEIKDFDAFGVTVNYAARVIHAVEGPDIGASERALVDLATWFGTEKIEKEWGTPFVVEMKGFGAQIVRMFRPDRNGPTPAETKNEFPLPEGLRSGAAPKPVPHHVAAAPQNFEHEDFLSHAEAFIDAPQGGRSRRVYGQVHLHERMFVQGEATNSRIEFGVRRFFVEVTKTGPGTLTAAEDLRRGVAAPRASLAPPRRRRRSSGNEVRICVDAEPGTSLGARAIPSIGEDNLLPELAVATAVVAAERLKVAVLLRVEPEAIHIDGEADRKVSARKRQLIAAIVGAAARKNGSVAEGGMIRRTVPVETRARDL